MSDFDFEMEQEEKLVGNKIDHVRNKVGKEADDDSLSNDTKREVINMLADTIKIMADRMFVADKKGGHNKIFSPMEAIIMAQSFMHINRDVFDASYEEHKHSLKQFIAFTEESLRVSKNALKELN